MNDLGVKPVVELKALTRSFEQGGERIDVLRGVDLAIRPGEIVALLGPSGSGKSTLTKLVQRLYVPEQGRVLVDGTDLALVDLAWLRRQVGVVLQENTHLGHY